MATTPTTTLTPCKCGWDDASHVSGVTLVQSADDRFRVICEGVDGSTTMAHGPGNGESLAKTYGEMHGVSVTIRKEIPADKLNEVMEFDHVIRVHDDGTVSEPSGLYAPSLFDGEMDSDKWSFWSTGYSGQDRYSGPIMHDSEFIGRGMAEDIFSDPGIYAAVVSCYHPEEDDEDADPAETIMEGWAIVKLNEVPA